VATNFTPLPSSLSSSLSSVLPMTGTSLSSVSGGRCRRAGHHYVVALKKASRAAVPTACAPRMITDFSIFEKTAANGRRGVQFSVKIRYQLPADDYQLKERHAVRTTLPTTFHLPPAQQAAHVVVLSRSSEL
jgi:hypothetical protein